MTKFAASLLTQLGVRVAAKVFDKPLTATLDNAEKAAGAVAGTYRVTASTIQKVKRTFSKEPAPTSKRETSLAERIAGAEAMADHHRRLVESHQEEAQRLMREGTQWFVLPALAAVILLLTRPPFILAIGGICLSLLTSLLVFNRARSEAFRERREGERNQASMEDRLDHAAKLRGHAEMSMSSEQENE